ncbi:hypothetical protein IEE94_04855 [Yimella sp. cx-573]|nr:hypothetical protein [Yimella sp. cx-573]
MMVEHVPGQLAIDIDDLIRQAELKNAGQWHGAPLGYTTDYYTPGEHQAAMDRWILEHTNFGSALSGIWLRAITSGARVPLDHGGVGHHDAGRPAAVPRRRRCLSRSSSER